MKWGHAPCRDGGSAGRDADVRGVLWWGQRSSVDELLSYSRPGQRQTTLAAGTTSYSVMIFYGAGLNATSFSATLNGVNVSSTFHPTAGGSEVVTIPLVTGRNVLKLSATGVVGGRTASDADQLVFKVP